MKALMILIAGPYRSGTGDDPQKMAANVVAMEQYALPLFRAGHIPVVGECGSRCRWSISRAPNVWGTQRSTRPSIPSPSAFFRGVTPSCEWVGHRRGRIRWSPPRAGRDFRCSRDLRTCPAAAHETVRQHRMPANRRSLPSSRSRLSSLCFTWWQSRCC